jgi:hypothetical protein
MAFLALDVAIVVGLAVAAFTINAWCVARRPRARSSYLERSSGSRSGR